MKKNNSSDDLAPRENEILRVGRISRNTKGNGGFSRDFWWVSYAGIP